MTIFLLMLLIAAFWTEIKFIGLELRRRGENRRELDSKLWTFRRIVLKHRIVMSVIVWACFGTLLLSSFQNLILAAIILVPNTLFWQILWRLATKMDQQSFHR